MREPISFHCATMNAQFDTLQTQVCTCAGLWRLRELRGKSSWWKQHQAAWGIGGTVVSIIGSITPWRHRSRLTGDCHIQALQKSQRAKLSWIIEVPEGAAWTTVSRLVSEHMWEPFGNSPVREFVVGESSCLGWWGSEAGQSHFLKIETRMI